VSWAIVEYNGYDKFYDLILLEGHNILMTKTGYRTLKWVVH